MLADYQAAPVDAIPCDPGACGFCPYHNVEFEDSGKNWVCTGFVQEINDEIKNKMVQVDKKQSNPKILKKISTIVKNLQDENNGDSVAIQDILVRCLFASIKETDTRACIGELVETSVLQKNKSGKYRVVGEIKTRKSWYPPANTGDIYLDKTFHIIQSLQEEGGGQPASIDNIIERSLFARMRESDVREYVKELVSRKLVKEYKNEKYGLNEGRDTSSNASS